MVDNTFDGEQVVEQRPPLNTHDVYRCIQILIYVLNDTKIDYTTLTFYRIYIVIYIHWGCVFIVR